MNRKQIKNVFLFPLIIISLILFLSSCGTETGNYLIIQGTHPGTLSSAISMITNPYAISQSLQTQESVAISVKNKSGDASGTLTLTDARLVLKDIKIKLSEEDTKTTAEEEENDKIKFRGPYIVNLITNTVTPSLPSLQLAAGTYKEIEMKLHKVDGNETSNNEASFVPEDDNLFDNSIYLAGTYTTAADVTKAFTFSFDLTEEFKLTGSNDTSEGFTISATEAYQIIIAFRLSKWFNFNNSETNSDNVDFDDLTNNSLQLNKDSEGNYHKVREVIRDNIKESADYGRDIDGDGKLGKSEDDDPDEDENDDDDD